MTSGWDATVGVVVQVSSGMAGLVVGEGLGDSDGLAAGEGDGDGVGIDGDSVASDGDGDGVTRLVTPGLPQPVPIETTPMAMPIHKRLTHHQTSGAGLWFRAR